MTYFFKKANTVFGLNTSFFFFRQFIFVPLISVLLLSCPGYSVENNAEKESGDWYVRLIVTAEDGRVDRGNVLGYLASAKSAKDSHDLPEMAPPPPPMGDRYLSIVFPHPEWGGDMPDYNSDFRAVPSGSMREENWNFEIRTHTPGIKVKLSWEGPADVLARSRLIGESGRILVADCRETADYPVMLDTKISRFVWQLRGVNKASSRKNVQ